jgi:deoxycytidine triphosphate deaminase
MAKHPHYLWKDPFEHTPSGAVLLSDQIHFLADAIGLIEPFDDKYLRPAAYDLRVGDVYYENDEPHELKEQPIEIPPNGVVYIRTKEKFNVPYYLVARYSLRVQQVYRGLMIDNGLHIDPGYCGHIWIPVHNFTTQPRSLPSGQEFISVEFNRTTGLPKEVNVIGTEDELVSRGIANELKGSNGRPVKVFYKDLERYRDRHKDFTPRLFWDKFPGEKHQSAMLGTEQRLGQVKGEIEKRLRTFRNLGYLATIGLIIGLLAIVLPILYAEWGKSREVEAQHGAEIRDLRDRLQEQKGRLDALVGGQSGPSLAPAAKSNPQPKAK